MNKNKNGNEDGETSTSSMKMSQGRNLTADNKMKRGESSSSCMRTEVGACQSQESSVEETTIELPPEMLTKILKYVDNSRLFDCRLISRQWCEISSEILTTRTDIMLKFKDYDTKWVRMDSGQGELQKYKSTRLQEFVNSMKQSKHCPYASFCFNVEDPSFFDENDWIEFLSLFAPPNLKQKQNQNHIQNQRTKIKCLHLRYHAIDNKEALPLFTEKLRDILVNKIPHLQELGLEFTSIFEDYKNVKLFPKLPEPESATKTVVSSASVPVQLPYLKVLEIEASTFGGFRGIVEDLLTAAVNLTTIHVDNPWWFEGVFQFLHSLGKLHLLKKVEIELDRGFLSSLRNSTKHSDFPLAFKLRELKLHEIITPDFYADATNFLSTLLESSKDTLEKLEMLPLGFLPKLQFPKFTKLRKLEIFPSADDYDDLNHIERRGQQFFPRGIRSREIFPAVDDLTLVSSDWENSFPQEDSIPIFPSVEHFDFDDCELQENVIAKLALMCPNLKHCTIKTDEGNPGPFNFPRVGREIWTHLKQLESLEVDVDVNLRNHAFPALDSCFTGISRDNCQRLSDLMKAEKAMKKSKSQVKLPESEELTTLTKREYPSILDMKSLKKLTINPHSGERQHQGENFFTTKITWISEEFAFKLMPNLEFNGRRPLTI